MAGPHDWDLIAERDAHFGVLSTDQFRAGALDGDALAAFDASGVADIAAVLAWLERLTGDRPHGGVALDIGCGLGRLSRAMRPHVDAVIGYDASETMLEKARARGGDGITYTAHLPEGPFAWINSYIVFQHIPPKEGLALLQAALSRAGPGAFASVQVTAWRDADRRPRSLLGRLVGPVRVQLARLGVISRDTLIRMHDYALSDVVRLFVDAGFAELHLRHTDHGGHHGVWILARRSA